MPSFSDFEAAEQPAKPVSEGEDTEFAVPENALVLQDRYTLVRPLGQGGMGTVFLAQDRRLSNRFCVVKKLRLDGFDRDDTHKATTFFEREAMILSSLKHPNVVSIQDYFQENGNYFLVMEYVKGNNLQQLLKKRDEPFKEKQVVDWAIAILDVLHYLHSHKPPVIYRDIKPSNIMLGTVDGIKLVDFGIARPYAEHSENTRIVSGGYSPPEQYWGGADLRSDIYALGATMYYLLTGKEPLALQTSSTRRFKMQISDHLDKIIQRATAQDVWLRYQTAMEMRQALTEIPSKARTALFPNYFLLAGVLALVFITCAAFVFLALNSKEGYFHREAMVLLSRNKDSEINASKESALWHIPFEIATLANNEEVISDPGNEGLNAVDQSKRQFFLKKR